MKYRVEISPHALHEIEEAYLWIREASPTRAYEWFNGLIEAIDSLEEAPMRCALAQENAAFPFEIRQMLYGKRGGIYRVLFRVVGGEVRILHVRHASREPLSSD
jgi:plasmid stabilization system protein ParE